MKKKMTKRLLCLVLAVLMFASLSVPASAKRTFTDVRGKDWFYNSVEYAVAKGYIKGMGNNIYAPTKTMNRAMVAQVLYNRSGATPPTSPSPFEDVAEGDWYKPCLTWCRENGIISDNLMDGAKFHPTDPISRQDVCVMVYNYVARMTSTFPSLASGEDMAKFSDVEKISGYANQAVRWAVKNEFLKGNASGSALYIDPLGSTKRSQMAQFFLNLDTLLGLDTTFTAPVDDEPEFVAPSAFSTKAGGVNVRGITFNPQNGYNAQIALGNNKLRSAESWSSIVKRTGAYVAVNGAFFESSGDKTTNATMVNNGEVLRNDDDGAPYRPAFVIDKNGKASIEHFQTIIDIKQFRGGEEVTTGILHALKNATLKQNDPWGIKMIYTSAYGSSVPVRVLNAVVVDANGTVTAKYQNQSNVPIPASGYVMVEVSKVGPSDRLLDSIQKGDVLKQEVTYAGSSTQDIQVALCCGPTVVKDGKAYGDASTYAQEGQSSVKRGNLPRIAIGVKADGTVVIVSATCDLPALSKAMAALGCKDAMNLDGGASTLIYNNGSTTIQPSRALSNVLVFTKS